MPCSKEALARLFLNLTASFKFLFLFLYFASLLFTKIFSLICGTDENEYTDEEQGSYQDEDEDDDMSKEETCKYFRDLEDFDEHRYSSDDDPLECFYDAPSSVRSSPKPQNKEKVTQDLARRNSRAVDARAQATQNLHACHQKRCSSRMNGEPPLAHQSNKATEDMKQIKFGKDDKYFIYTPPKMEQRKLDVLDNKEGDEILVGEPFNVGSTSKSSSEWRSSMQDSTTDDPFSSSSRRNCQRWESYTVFQKYDEEMHFLDRLSAQKLHETETLRSFKVQPRSISERIVYKFSTDKMKTSYVYRQNPYHELEAAYVSQICIAWEALSWNYYNFKQKRASRNQEPDRGCPAKIAQQFQQFQVFLQHYIETEPFEYGRRPEIYARMRTMTPKLLQVPEYQDDEEEHEEEKPSSRIPSASFMVILEDAIRTFMWFLEADHASHCQLLAAIFRRNGRRSVDPVLIRMARRKNQKMKQRLKDLHRAGNCFKKRKLNKDEDIGILMGLVDLKVVSRVLRMSDITQEQLRWCEEKMGRMRIAQGKLYRDSSPLFLPSRNVLL
ncbi:hypothetical protein Droror1_Dr00006186 [Drosera rotundifolia]